MKANPLQLETLIGRGGMGEVWAAHEGLASSRVAVKRARTDISEARWARRQFSRELDFLAMLRGVRCVPALLRVANFEGHRCAVMRLVHGATLAASLKHLGRPPLDVTATLVSRLMAATAEVHRRGINHCDIKPANVLLERGHGRTRLLLVDFGLACRDHEETSFRRHLVMGTTGYMSPELLVGANCNPASVDCWSIAVVAYELIVGRRPFAGPGLRELCMAVMRATYVHPTQLGAGNNALDAFFARAFAPRPSARFSSLAVMQREWRAAIHAPPSEPALELWLSGPWGEDSMPGLTPTRRARALIAPPPDDGRHGDASRHGVTPHLP